MCFRRCRTHRQSRRTRVRAEYRDTLAEIFCLQQLQPGFVGADVTAAARSSPTPEFVAFLDESACRDDVFEQVRKEVAASAPIPPAATAATSQPEAPTVPLASSASTAQTASATVNHKPPPLTLPPASVAVSSPAAPSRLPPAKSEPSSSTDADPASASATPTTPSQQGTRDQEQPQQQEASTPAAVPESAPPPPPLTPRQEKVIVQKRLMGDAYRAVQEAAARQRQKKRPADCGAQPSPFAYSSLMKQEGYVLRRVGELQREGLWSGRRLPKVCERPRPKTHHDALLGEMQWLAVDFAQERTWKKSAAKMLAYSAKAFVETWPERREKLRMERDRKRRRLASFQASEIDAFWSRMGELADAKDRMAAAHSTAIAVCATPRRRKGRGSPVSVAASPAALVNGVLDAEDDDAGGDDQEYLMDFDDESTISEQERHEQRASSAGEKPQVEGVGSELTLLAADVATPLESLVPSEYFELGDGRRKDSDWEDSDDESAASTSSAASSLSSLSETDLSDITGADVEALEPSGLAAVMCSLPRSLPPAPTLERVTRVNLKPRQRQLYDDYLATSSVKCSMESGDAKEIAAILARLRDICNHPRLSGGGFDGDPPVRLRPSFPRVSDRAYHRLVTSALDYDPYRHVDLDSLNLVYLTHEVRLTAITSDRIRKFCAPRRLIEELPTSAQSGRPAAPPVPRGKLGENAILQQVAANASAVGARTLNRTRSLNMRQQQPQKSGSSSAGSSPAKAKVAAAKEDATKAGSSSADKAATKKLAFHAESLKIIARFNERRCRGLPLYGQDLISALYIMKPSGSRSGHLGSVGGVGVGGTPITPSKRPTASSSTSSSSSSRVQKTSQSGYLECMEAADSWEHGDQSTALADLVSVSRASEESVESVGTLVASPVDLVHSWSPSIYRAERKVVSDLSDLSSTLRLPLAPDPAASLSSPTMASSLSAAGRIDLAAESAKLEELMLLLHEFRLVSTLLFASIFAMKYSRIWPLKSDVIV